jgi:glycosyltransferase involved in cell wall biosynthesis
MRPAPRSIVFVINSLTAGGAERALIDLLTHLEKYLTGYTVHLVQLDLEQELHTVPAWVHKHVLNANFSFFWSTVSLARLLRHLMPAVTVSFLNRSNCANVISSKMLNYPCIISERTHTTSRFRAGLEAVITKAITRLTYPYADAVIAVSEGVKDDLVTNFGVREEKIHVIYNAIDTDHLCRRSLEASSVSVPGPYIVSAGRLVPSKNFRLLMESYRSSGISENLIILGEGEQRSELEALISSLRLDGRVVLPGHMDNPYPVIGAARLFVSSSNLEGFPNALIEAMALGCPVVATDCDTGPMEILAAGKQPRCTEITLAEYGILVPVNSADLLAEAIRLGCSENIRTTYSERSKCRAQDFGVRNSVEKYWSIIERYARSI